MKGRRELELRGSGMGRLGSGLERAAMEMNLEEIACKGTKAGGTDPRYLQDNRRESAVVAGIGVCEAGRAGFRWAARQMDWLIPGNFETFRAKFHEGGKASGSFISIFSGCLFVQCAGPAT